MPARHRRGRRHDAVRLQRSSGSARDHGRRRVRPAPLRARRRRRRTFYPSRRTSPGCSTTRRSSATSPSSTATTQTRLLQLRDVDGCCWRSSRPATQPSDIRVLRWRLDADDDGVLHRQPGRARPVFPPPHDFEWDEDHPRAARLGPAPAHLDRPTRSSSRRSSGDLTVKVENNTEAGRASSPRAGRRAAAEPGRAEVALRPGRAADPDPGPALQGDAHERYWSSTPHQGGARSTASAGGLRSCPRTRASSSPAATTSPPAWRRRSTRDAADLEFEQRLRAPNGEDVLYVFHARRDGRYLLLPYNVIRKEMSHPVACHGYSLFDDGTLVRPARGREGSGSTPSASTPARSATRSATSRRARREPSSPASATPSWSAALGELLQPGPRRRRDPSSTGRCSKPRSRANRLLDAHAWLQEPEADGRRRAAAPGAADRRAACSTSSPRWPRPARRAPGRPPGRADVDGYLSRHRLELRDTDAFLELMSRASPARAAWPTWPAALRRHGRGRGPAGPGRRRSTGARGRALEFLADPGDALLRSRTRSRTARPTPERRDCGQGRRRQRHGRRGRRPARRADRGGRRRSRSATRPPRRRCCALGDALARRNAVRPTSHGSVGPAHGESAAGFRRP